ncbi:MAG: YmdB family metallophosphoesterase [Treponema sp.]|jgi:metallophosphoesterase (TIGR00282 family)|nr:YmdB family metallophosphoesterase [Treponema sp.]
MKILYVAEIVGKTGVYAFKKGLPELRRRLLEAGQQDFDFVIACADGATGGNGLGRNHAAYLRKLGAQVLTTGECCFYKKDLTENLGKLPYVLRPENLNLEAPGIGARIFKAGSEKIAVTVLLGQSGFGKIHGNSPYSILPSLLERLRRETPFVIIDFHAEATAEKKTLFAEADGRCSAVIGSHTRVQTADETVLPGGTAVICDAGRTGSAESVGGTEIESRIREYLSSVPDWTREAVAKPELQGVIVDLDSAGKALSIERVRLELPEMPRKDEGKDAEGQQSAGDDAAGEDGAGEEPEAG